MKISIIPMFMLLILVGCGKSNIIVGEGSTVNVLDGIRPPDAMVQINNELHDTVIGSFCWSSGNQSVCADTAGSVELLKGRDPIPVKPGELIEFVMDDEPKPNQFHVTQVHEDKMTEVEWKGTRLNAPTVKGLYYYSIGTWWMDDIVENLSHGDSSYNFVIEVQ